jgi:hypothetical protein
MRASFGIRDATRIVVMTAGDPAPVFTPLAGNRAADDGH